MFFSINSTHEMMDGTQEDRPIEASFFRAQPPPLENITTRDRVVTEDEMDGAAQPLADNDTPEYLAPRQWLSQVGLLAYESYMEGRSFRLLKKSSALWRDLKGLDKKYE